MHVVNVPYVYDCGLGVYGVGNDRRGNWRDWRGPAPCGRGLQCGLCLTLYIMSDMPKGSAGGGIAYVI